MIFALVVILALFFGGERIVHEKEYRQLRRMKERIARAQSCKKPLVERLNSKQAPEWMRRQIEKDLKRAISQEGLDLTMALESQGGDLELVRFIIKDNEIKTEVNRPYLQENRRLKLMLFVFNQLKEIAPLPDVDFIFCMGDTVDGHEELPGPIFAFAKNIHSENVVLIPDYDALIKSEKFLREMKRGKKNYPWAQKVDQLFWRGAMTGSPLGPFKEEGGYYSEKNFLYFPRTQVVSLSLSHPESVDARFNVVSQCANPKKMKERFAPYFGSFVSLRDHLKYKYQLLVDGNSCAYARAYWQLFSDCLMFKQESPNQQWYYEELKPYVHYVPVAEDMSDLLEKIEWAKGHEKEVQEIIRAANLFAEEHLQLVDMYHYIYLLLVEYSKRMA